MPYGIHNKLNSNSEKVQLARIASRPRAFQRAIDEVRVTFTSRSNGEFVVFMNKIQVNRIKSDTKFCVKTFSGKVVVEPFPLKVYRCWR